MKEYAKRVDSDSAGNVRRSRAVYCARPDDYVTETIFPRIINNEFFLFQFCKSVGSQPYPKSGYPGSIFRRVFLHAQRLHSNIRQTS